MSDPALKPEDVEWCRRHFSAMNDGGVWLVPRFGLVYTRDGETLALTSRLAIGRPRLAAIQQIDYELTKRHFEAAGVTVEDRTPRA